METKTGVLHTECRPLERSSRGRVEWWNGRWQVECSVCQRSRKAYKRDVTLYRWYHSSRESIVGAVSSCTLVSRRKYTCLVFISECVL